MDQYLQTLKRSRTLHMDFKRNPDRMEVPERYDGMKNRAVSIIHRPIKQHYNNKFANVITK